jgi:hypothetical protein
MLLDKFKKAIQRIDELNSQDPNQEIFESISYAKELLYSNRMIAKLMDFCPSASLEVQIAAKAQHICRWKIARDSYPMDRIGYLKWREELKKFHAQTTAEILRETGFDESFIDKVSFLIEKKLIKKNPETQLLEDVICLVFLEFYLNDFVQKHDQEKLKNIIQKTWAKMSESGHEAALSIHFSPENLALIQKSIAS